MPQLQEDTMTGGAEARGGGQALHSRALHRLLCARELSDAEGSALICLLFPVGLAMQVLACFNAEFNLEQGEAGNIWEPLHYLLYGTGVQNFEWSVEYAIRTPLFVFPLVLLAFPARLLPVSKLQVLYSIRYASAALSCASLCFLAHSLRRTLGNEASVLGLLLCLFNHGLSLALGRLGVDSMTIALHCAAIGLWQRRRPVWLIWVCAVASFNRANFAVPTVCMGLHVLILQRPSQEEWVGGGHCVVGHKSRAQAGAWAWFGGCGNTKRWRRFPFGDLFPSVLTPGAWFLFLLAHALTAVAVVGTAMFVSDSWWYGRWTFSWYNFVKFNLMDQGADNFGRMKAWFYLDKLLLDNNLVVSVFGLLGVALSRQAATVAAPSLALLAVLFTVPHKEYRFLFPLLPALAFCAGTALHRIRRNSLIGQGLVSLVLLLHMFSGLSLLLLQAAVYAPHAHFAREAASLVRSAAHRRISVCPGAGAWQAGTAGGGGACLCTFPWCSWLLPEECDRVYITCVYEEFFTGYSNATYRRFEARNESALLDIAPEDGSYTYRSWHQGVGVSDSYIKHESRRLARMKRGGRALAGGWLSRADHRVLGLRRALDSVAHVFFFEISSSPFPRFKTAYSQVTGRTAPNKTVHHVYSDLMLAPFLDRHGFSQQAVAVGVAEPGIFNFDPAERVLALWLLAPGTWKAISTYTIHSVWTRYSPGTARLSPHTDTCPQ